MNWKPSGQTVSNYGLSFQGDCWVAEFTILPPVRPRPWQIAKLWDSRPCIDSPGCRSPKWQFSRPGQPRRKACCCKLIIKDEAAKCHKGASSCNRNLAHNTSQQKRAPVGLWTPVPMRKTAVYISSHKQRWSRAFPELKNQQSICATPRSTFLFANNGGVDSFLD